MANRQQRRAAQKGGMQAIVEGLQKAAAKQTPEDEAEDLNILPKPNKQEIKKDLGLIEWYWYCGLYTVHSCLQTPTGEYKIELTGASGETPQQIFEPEEAKMVGQALLSAWNWQEIWQMHAGSFIAADMGLGAPVVDSDDNE